GLVAAIGTCFAGAAWQRCRVHFMRNILAKMPKVTGPMVTTIIRTIFVPRDNHDLVRAQSDEVVTMLARSQPQVTDMPDNAGEDLLAFAEFLPTHWQQIWSTNPLEQLNKEIKRRTNVVSVFPNPAALLRLAGHVLIEQHDKWDSADHRYDSEGSMKLLTTDPEEVATTAIDAA
ncbi:MAG: transposase, partial [Beutenbergiaceae bacterium]